MLKVAKTNANSPNVRGALSWATTIASASVVRLDKVWSACPQTAPRAMARGLLIAGLQPTPRRRLQPRRQPPERRWPSGGGVSTPSSPGAEIPLSPSAETLTRHSREEPGGEASGLAQQAVTPLQPQPLQPLRCTLLGTGGEVERGANAEDDRGRIEVPQPACHMVLVGGADADPQQLGS